MLPKKNRADKKEIEDIFKKSEVLNSPSLTFKFVKGGSGTKISFIAPKSVARLAVKRNLLRRRGYAVLGKYINHFPVGLMGAFVFRKYQDDISILENEIKTILKIILGKIN